MNVATCKVLTAPEPVEPENVELRLTRTEAKILVTLFGWCVTGSGPGRVTTTAIYRALRDQGVWGIEPQERAFPFTKNSRVEAIGG